MSDIETIYIASVVFPVITFGHVPGRIKSMCYGEIYHCAFAFAFAKKANKRFNIPLTCLTLRYAFFGKLVSQLMIGLMIAEMQGKAATERNI